MSNVKIILGISAIIILGLSIWSTSSLSTKAIALETLQVTPTPTPTPQSWLSWFGRVLGVTATSSNQKGIEGLTGNVWVADLLEQKRFPVKNADGGYRWAIFLPCNQGILALKNDTVIKITAFDTNSPNISTVATNSQIKKLVGFVTDDTDKIFILKNDDSVGLLSLASGQVTPLSFDADTEEKIKQKEEYLNILKSVERVYGTTVLNTNTQIKQSGGKTITWTDVFIRRGEKPQVNVSKCDGINCGQPSLSPEGRYVVYIKAIS